VASSPSWQQRVADALGPVADAEPLGAGVWRCRAGGRDVVVKAAAGTADEAAGLRALAGVDGGPPVPEVLVDGDGLLVTSWVAAAHRSGDAEEGLGGDLARLHAAPWPAWGGGSSWIGGCRVDPGEQGDGRAFYAHRLTGLAAACGLERDIEPVVARLADLLPPGGPALLHGDLWWGNVRWGVDGRAWLIDPSAHGGHPEEDLAMLALFGPLPDRLLAAYRAVRPLDGGWRERRPLFQLVPLLVHTVLFGGEYRQSAVAAARRYA
jgi:fructosamine-3-kinase